MPGGKELEASCHDSNRRTTNGLGRTAGFRNKTRGDEYRRGGMNRTESNHSCPPSIYSSPSKFAPACLRLPILRGSYHCSNNAASSHPSLARSNETKQNKIKSYINKRLSTLASFLLRSSRLWVSSSTPQLFSQIQVYHARNHHDETKIFLSRTAQSYMVVLQCFLSVTN